MAAPCTNHLVECEYCKEERGQRPVFWSYNLVAHHRAEHAAHPHPRVGNVRAGTLEKEMVLQVGRAPNAKLSELLKMQFKAQKAKEKQHKSEASADAADAAAAPSAAAGKKRAHA